ncbi:MAG: ABC transporter substrate-binding protein [Oliverpabstia sp.]|nr:ABC transporter substrate-binding protein [Oliverpabstia sp.]
MKRLIASLLIGTMAISLVACASEEKSKSESSKEGTEERQKESSEGEEGVTELVYWKSYNVDVYKEFIDKFNEEHPDIHVSYETFPDHQSTLQKIQVQASAGNAKMPNVIQLDTCMTATVDSVAPLVDLKPYLDSSEELRLDNFYETFQEEAYVGDKLAGLHVCANCDLLFYNKEIFREAGLDPEKPPQTWNEVLEYGKQIKENCAEDIIPFAYTGITGDYYEQFSWEWQAMVQSAGGQLFNEDYTEPMFNSKEGIEALEFLVGAVTEHEIASLSYPEKGFENGKLGMYMDGSWSINTYQEALGENLGVGLMPGKVESKVMIGGDQMMIVDSGDQKINDAAFEFLAYMMSPEVIIGNSKDQGELVCQKSIAETDEYKEYLGQSKAMQIAQSAMEHSAYRARTPWYDEWSQLVYTICEPCLYGEISCADALKDLEMQTKDIISKYE